MEKGKMIGMKTWMSLGLLSGILLVAVACRKAQAPLDIPQLVKTTRVSAHSGSNSVSYPGKIKAAENVKLAFRVAGPIKKMYVNEGQKVKKGQLLAELDPRDYQLQFNGTQAEYNQILGESDRVIELYHRGSVSVNEYDKAVAAEKRITALYEVHRNALNDTRLRAPFDGYIQNKYFSAPEIVNQGTPVLSMMDDNYFEVEVDVPVKDFIRREDFSGFQAVADAFPGVELPLELLDINQGANYNQLFNARFRLKRNAHPGLAAGMSVSVNIDFKPMSGNRTVIPVSALFQEDGESYVWLYNEKYKVVEKLPVRIEQIMKTGEAVVLSGLREGQAIVSAGVNNLKEGQKVNALPPVPASNVGGLLFIRLFATPLCRIDK